MKPIKLIVEVEGGCVQEVYADTSYPIAYSLLDHDGLEDVEDGEDQESLSELQSKIDSGAFLPVSTEGAQYTIEGIQPGSVLEMMIDPSKEATTATGRESQIRFAHYTEGWQEAYKLLLEYFLEKQPSSDADTEEKADYEQFRQWIMPLYIQVEQRVQELLKTVNMPEKFEDKEQG